MCENLEVGEKSSYIPPGKLATPGKLAHLSVLANLAPLKRFSPIQQGPVLAKLAPQKLAPPGCAGQLGPGQLPVFFGTFGVKISKFGLFLEKFSKNQYYLDSLKKKLHILIPFFSKIEKKIGFGPFLTSMCIFSAQLSS